MAKAVKESESTKATREEKERAVCGIIMPIASNDEYTSEHWSSVRDIIERSIIEAKMEPRPVWLGGDAEIIHRRIIFNLYQCEYAVCDVSSWNPNVMFELGIRLTFNKPTLVISDGANRPLFDIGLIEHVPYPRDLNFHGIEDFIEALASKLGETKSAKDKGIYRSFIDELGPFDVVTPKSTDVSPSDFALEQIQNVAAAVSRLERKLETVPKSTLGRPASLKIPHSMWTVNFPVGASTHSILEIDGSYSAAITSINETDDGISLDITVVARPGSVNDERLRARIKSLGGTIMKVAFL